MTVTNKEEEGTITLSTGQPKVILNADGDPTAEFTATLIDPDGKVGANAALVHGHHGYPAATQCFQCSK